MHTLRRISGERFRDSYPRRHLVFILYICAYLLSAWLACALQLSRVCIHTTRDDGGGSGRGGEGETGVVYLTQSARRTYTYCMCVCVPVCIWNNTRSRIYLYTSVGLHRARVIVRSSRTAHKAHLALFGPPAGRIVELSAKKCAYLEKKQQRNDILCTRRVYVCVGVCMCARRFIEWQIAKR